MDLDMAIRAVGVLRVQVVLWASRFLRANAMRHAVTRQTELRYAAGDQHAGVRGAVRRVTRDTPVGLYRRMFVHEWTLFVRVTLDTRGIGAGRESGLLQLKTTVRIVTIAALHRAFEHFVMERQIELVLGLTVTTEAKLRFARLEQTDVGNAGLLRIGCGDKHVRSGELAARRWRMARVAIGATDVVAPVFATTEVVVFFPARVTAETGFRSLF
jgi:hypothetical protein